MDRAKLKSDEWVLIYGGTSGVGSAAIQIAKELGAIVISTVGNNNKMNYAYEMGSDFVFLHNDCDVCYYVYACFYVYFEQNSHLLLTVVSKLYFS